LSTRGIDTTQGFISWAVVWQTVDGVCTGANDARVVVEVGTVVAGTATVSSIGTNIQNRVDTLSVLTEIQGASVVVTTFIIGTATSGCILVSAALKSHANVGGTEVAIVTVDITFAAPFNEVVATVTSNANIFGAQVTIKTISIVHTVHNEFPVDAAIDHVTGVHEVTGVNEIARINKETSVNEITGIDPPVAIVVRAGVRVGGSWEEGLSDRCWFGSVPL